MPANAVRALFLTLFLTVPALAQAPQYDARATVYFSPAGGCTDASEPGSPVLLRDSWAMGSWTSLTTG